MMGGWLDSQPFIAVTPISGTVNFSFFPFPLPWGLDVPNSRQQEEAEAENDSGLWEGSSCLDWERKE
jgi:hypothetical protein